MDSVTKRLSNLSKEIASLPEAQQRYIKRATERYRALQEEWKKQRIWELRRSP